MMTHSEIEQALTTAFAGMGPASGVTVVAQYENDALSLPSSRAHVFIPDFHLLHPDDAAKFPHYHFRLDQEIDVLFDALRGLKTREGDGMQVWHLGDLFDIWRCVGRRGDQVEVDSIAEYYAQAIVLLRNSAPVGAGAAILAGNHDYALWNMPEWRARRFALLKSPNADGDVLILHGDIFSAVETMVPEQIRAFGVRFAKWVKSGSTTLDYDRQLVRAANAQITDGDALIGLEGVIGIQSGHSSSNVSKATELDPKSTHAKFFAGARSIATALDADGYNIRVVVVGHTHQARIVVGERSLGNELVLMDCGAWFGRCRFSATDPWIWSAQIAALIGNEMRIYQIGRKPAVL